jgi:NAD(P)H dehydrogenase (quinone)
MSKVLVLYYSSYGHIEAMATAVAEGARDAGAQVDIKRVPELVSDEVARNAHYKVDQAAPIAKVDELAAYDAIIIGTGTRFGRVSSQMANFLDQAGGLWARGALHGKVGGAFTSTATQHGGQETTLFSIITNLLHFGMVVVGLDHRRRRWLAVADRQRAGWSALPGAQDCGGCEQAARLMPRE